MRRLLRGVPLKNRRLKFLSWLVRVWGRGAKEFRCSWIIPRWKIVKLSFETKYVAKHQQSPNEIWWHSSWFTLYIILLPFHSLSSVWEINLRSRCLRVRTTLSGGKVFAFSAGKNLFLGTILLSSLEKPTRWRSTAFRDGLEPGSCVTNQANVLCLTITYKLFGCSTKDEIFNHFVTGIFSN